MKNKLGLGLIVKNEEENLKRCLPIILRAGFDGVVAVDTGSTDATKEVLSLWNATVVDLPGERDSGKWRNTAIAEAERQGMDWLLMIDADETMFPEDIKHLKDWMEVSQIGFIVLPRIEFVKDTRHFRPYIFPDGQGRLLRLHEGLHYRNPVHEIVYRGDKQISEFELGAYEYAVDCPIYHYGWMEHNWRTKTLYYFNREREKGGLEPVEEFPPEVIVTEPEFFATAKVFCGRQPQ